MRLRSRSSRSSTPRGRSLRTTIIALITVPIVALIGLWAFATLATTGQVWDLRTNRDIHHRFGGPLADLTRAVQDERRAAVERLATPVSRTALATLQRDEQTTDGYAAAVRSQAAGPHRSELDADQRTRLADVLAAVDRLAPLRRSVALRSVSWEEALNRYSTLLEPAFRLRTSLTTRLPGELARQSTVLTELVRAREYVSQEDAALAGLRGSVTPDDAQFHLLDDAIEAHDLLFALYRPELPDEDRALYDTAFHSGHWTALHTYEQLFQGEDGTSGRNTFDATAWRSATGPVLADLAAADDQVSGRIGDLYWQTIRRGLLAGAAGLLAVVLTLALSARIGRALLRELVALRNAAEETAGTRLPEIMRLARKGQPVPATEQRPPSFRLREARQVGDAIQQVERAAVRAAAAQARLRGGVAAVLVSLARRSQVLLHRQLTLLDAMEGRTQDADELADLFRLDQLATRMRRQAEGLVVLSGGSSGRTWRHPVPLVDVVRAAVGEIEDYPRVTVRAMPGAALTGLAVPDVTHLLAELIENAAVCSPPDTRVTVTGQHTTGGFVLEVEDQGLGMGPETLAEANRRLAEDTEFDLSDADRLGLSVAGRLARRHGIQVALQRSPHGGTRAVVLLPRELLSQAAEEPHPPAVATGRPPRQDTGRRPAGPLPARTEPATTPGGLPRRSPRALDTPAMEGHSH